MKIENIASGQLYRTHSTSDILCNDDYTIINAMHERDLTLLHD